MFGRLLGLPGGYWIPSIVGGGKFGCTEREFASHQPAAWFAAVLFNIVVWSLINKLSSSTVAAMHPYRGSYDTELRNLRRQGGGPTPSDISENSSV